MRNPFQPVSDVTVSSRVYDEIRKAIFTAKLRPGESLVEARLSAEFQVSQTSVREALFHLERYDLVRRIPNKGTFVTKLTMEEIKDRMEVRALLEVHAGIQAAPRMREEDLQELSRRAEGIAAAVSQNAYFETPVLDIEFHRYIWENSGNKVLSHTLERLSAPTFVFNAGLTNAQHTILKQIVNPHEDIVAAFRRGEPEVIKEAIQAHFDNAYQLIAGIAVEESVAED